MFFSMQISSKACIKAFPATHPMQSSAGRMLGLLSCCRLCHLYIYLVGRHMLIFFSPARKGITGTICR